MNNIPTQNFIQTIFNESFEDPETYHAFGGLKSDNSKPVGAEARLTGQALNKGGGAQTPDAYMNIGNSSSTHEVKTSTKTTDTMGQKKVNVSADGEFSLGGKETPMTALAKNMDIMGHIKRALPADHSFADEGQIAHRSHGPLRANRSASAIAAAAGQSEYRSGKQQLTIPLTPDQFRSHAKNMSNHEDYLHMDGVAAGIPYHSDHPHASDKDVAHHFAPTALSQMSDKQIEALAPHAVVRAKYGSRKAGYSGEMSVRFGNHDALHALGAPHKTVDSFRHGVVNSGGSLHSGHYQNKDGSFHPAGVKAMHQAIATVQFHGRGHETDRFFVKDDHMTDFYDNHYDENEIAKHTAQLRKGFKPPAKVNEETSVMKKVVSKLVEYSGAQFQDKMVNQDLNTKKDEDKKESPSLPRLQPTGVRDLFKTIGSQTATSLLGGPAEPENKGAENKGEDDETDKKDSEKTTQSSPPAQEPVRAEPKPVTVSDEDKERSQRSSGRTVSPGAANESMFHIASALRENDENYSDDEISRDKDPNAAGGPYSEDDIKVTQDPRDAAPGMDPVADPPTLQAKQVTTGMTSKAPAAAGTMQTMLPGGEHDAIQKQYPDLIEGLFGGEDEMKGFLMDPKDKKKSKAACAIMAMLDKKLKDDKKTRVSKILNNNKPPAIPGSEGY
jgi:hypothetical protein